MYSLWRGDVLLGHINPELPGDSDATLFGVLDPSAAFFPGQAISQLTMLDWPGMPVFQHINSHAPTSAGAHRQVAAVPPVPLGEAMRDSVPSERQLALRDATNTPVATRTITVMSMARANPSIQQRCQAVGVTFRGWTHWCCKARSSQRQLPGRVATPGEPADFTSA